ncbi:hypothetical protein KUTeg_010725, partial [Tegillarca granosa]
MFITKALILISKKRNQAYGIKVTRNGETKLVKANREIIVSAGAIETPKLLQLSGIGPKNVLRRLKIRPQKILPVGVYAGSGIDYHLFVDLFKQRRFNYPETGRPPMIERPGRQNGTVRVLQKMIKTPAMRRVNAELDLLAPAPNECRSLVADSDEQWECIIRYQAGAAAHPVGTCKMGNPDDPTTVVDPYL